MNHIKTMPPEMFLPCPKLTQIILRDNELTQVRPSQGPWSNTLVVGAIFHSRRGKRTVLLALQ